MPGWSCSRLFAPVATGRAIWGFFSRPPVSPILAFRVSDSSSPSVPRPRWRDLFAVDLRSLAALRIGLGAVLLFDLAFRARFLSAFYTDEGVFPAEGMPWTCAHAWVGSAAGEGVLFGLAALSAGFLLVGRFTRTATAACWFLTNSLDLRNPMLCDGGDSLLVLVLLWSLFLPLGARWSLDARRRPPPPGPSVVNLATAALLLQPAVMYFSSALQKSGPEWRDGTAVWYAVHHDLWARPLAFVLRERPGICKLLTFGTRLTEFVAPLLLFCPWGARRPRWIGLALLTLLQLGLALSIQVWLFPVHSTLALLPFLPPESWSAVGRRVPARIRPWFEERSGPSSGAAPSRAPRLAVPLLLFVGLVTLIAMTGRPLPTRLLRLGTPLGLVETWGMYAPSPYREESRLTLLLRDGDGKDLEPAAALEPSRRRTMLDMSEDYRGKYYLETVVEDERLLSRYAAWIGRGGDPGRPPIRTVRLRITTWPIGSRDESRAREISYPFP